MLKLNSLLFKQFNLFRISFFSKIILIISMLASLSLFNSCCESSVGPVEDTNNGSIGKVIDIEENPVKGVDVYYIYTNFESGFSLNKANFLTKINNLTDTLDFNLYQNYPNQFNPTTIIKHSINNKQ